MTLRPCARVSCVQDQSLWTAYLRKDRRKAVVKLFPVRGAEATKLELLSCVPELGVVPILAHCTTVCPGLSGILMPRLDTFGTILGTRDSRSLIVSGLDWLVKVPLSTRHVLRVWVCTGVLLGRPFWLGSPCAGFTAT